MTMIEHQSTATEDGERGIILIAVLVVVSAVALAVSAFNVSVTVSAQVVRADLASATLDHALDAGLELGVGGLVASAGPRWPADGTVHDSALGDSRITVTVQDARGLVDLNVAPPILLAAAITAGGADQDLSEQLVRMVLARRARAEAAARADTLGRSAPNETATTTTSRAFAEVADLFAGTTFPPHLQRSIARFVTVHTGKATINPMTAPVPLLRRLLSVSELQAVLAARAPGGDMAAVLAQLSTTAGPLFASGEGAVYRIVTTAATPGLDRPTVQIADVLVPSGGDIPYHVLTLRQDAIEP